MTKDVLLPDDEWHRERSLRVFMSRRPRLRAAEARGDFVAVAAVATNLLTGELVDDPCATPSKATPDAARSKPIVKSNIQRAAIGAARREELVMSEAVQELARGGHPVATALARATSRIYESGGREEVLAQAYADGKIASVEEWRDEWRRRPVETRRLLASLASIRRAEVGR